MEAKDREGFVRAWGNVLMQSWEDEDFKERLHADPESVLREQGIEIAAGARVELVPPPGDAGPDLDAQIAAYEEGAQSGTYRFYVQDSNQVQTQELGESELEGVAAGACCSSILSCCCC